jgi:hypothetical protein
MPPVQRADSHREGQVVRFLAGQQLKLLGRGELHAQSPRVDLGSRVALGEGHTARGSVDHEDVAVPDPGGDGTGRRSRSAADLQDPHPGSKRQRIHDRREPSR